LEFLGILIGQCTWCPSGGGGGLGLGMLGVFNYGSLTIWSGADNNNVIWIFNGDDHSCGKFDFLPGFFNVQDVDTL
jgi:hypothetical protein